jgi:hypothetical protein
MFLVTTNMIGAVCVSIESALRAEALRSVPLEGADKPDVITFAASRKARCSS